MLPSAEPSRYGAVLNWLIQWLESTGSYAPWCFVALFIAAFVVDYVVLGGGNTKRIEKLPPKTRRGANANAFTGGFRLWSDSTTART